MAKEIQTNFFQVIVYPAECPQFESILQRAGVLWISPLHTPCEEKKPHYHVMIRYERKTTANVFMGVLVDKLNNDFTGIAVCMEKLAVNDIKSVLRYNLHRDIPYKEQFELDEVLANTNTTYCAEVARAFDAEIRAIVTKKIDAGELCNYLEVSYMFGADNWVIPAWLLQGRNTQYVYNLLYAQQRRQYERRY